MAEFTGVFVLVFVLLLRFFIELVRLLLLKLWLLRRSNTSVLSVGVLGGELVVEEVTGNELPNACDVSVTV